VVVGLLEPERNENGTNVLGCGLVMDTKDKLAIFFTLNGKLKVKGKFGGDGNQNF
jgi:hypothetical protein